MARALPHPRTPRPPRRPSPTNSHKRLPAPRALHVAVQCLSTHEQTPVLPSGQGHDNNTMAYEAGLVAYARSGPRGRRRLRKEIFSESPSAYVKNGTQCGWSAHPQHIETVRAPRFACVCKFIKNTGVRTCGPLTSVARSVARRTLSLDFLRPPSPPSSQAYNFESVLEEITRAYPNTRIRPSFTLVWTGPNSQINGLGVAVFSSCYCYSLLPKL